VTAAEIAPAEIPIPPRSYIREGMKQFTGKVIFYLTVLTTVSIVGFPILWMVLCSFKGGGELYASPPTFFPNEWTLQNYIDLFVQTSFLTYFMNRLIVALGSTALSLLIGGIGAYSLSRFTFFGMQTFAGATLVTYMLPEVLLVLPLYIIIVQMGLADTLWALIISNTAFMLPLTLWFMRSYFNSITISLEESAMIDGCTRLQAMWKVTIPLALPGLISVGVLAFNHAWNEFLFALVLTSSERNKILPLGIATWIGQDAIYSWGMLLAGGVLITLPVMFFYLIVQRSLVAGLTDGGVKGE
jgi:ABC-type glycerol-3-phosphate transport system permease component